MHSMASMVGDCSVAAAAVTRHLAAAYSKGSNHTAAAPGAESLASVVVVELRGGAEVAQAICILRATSSRDIGGGRRATSRSTSRALSMQPSPILWQGYSLGNVCQLLKAILQVTRQRAAAVRLGRVVVVVAHPCSSHLGIPPELALITAKPAAVVAGKVQVAA
jgi:hypothetical protein